MDEVAMKEMDGYTLILQLRALEVFWEGSILTITLTVFARSDRQKIILASFQKHLTKPIDLAKLAAPISELTKHNNLIS
ncbi:hypothetical protein IQ238_26865 [Pleurocapsales cyanobacterium LEGE 06147]|nr:hypothetical protein [Pleurocapsales cyanobacterium LEGE 06147]